MMNLYTYRFSQLFYTFRRMLQLCFPVNASIIFHFLSEYVAYVHTAHWFDNSDCGLLEGARCHVQKK